MKFSSQICTTKEQSERLLALGLRRETADMCWTLADSDREGNEYSVEYMSIGQGKYQLMHPNWYTPAWSLHRLIEMYTEHYVCEHINLKLLTYDTIIENIRLDILTGTFNKDYLELK